MPAAVFVVRATVTDPAKREAFGTGYSREHLPDAMKSFGAVKAWRYWSATDPSLHQFTRLLQDAAFDVIAHLGKAKWLDPADLFYLGFHFAEQTHRAREFGGKVLEMAVQRSPKSEVGKQAKRKLKSEGLA